MSTESFKILIVEDDVESRKLLQYLLKPEGYNLAVAGDGREALRMVGAAPPDMILLDAMLPQLSGFQVCQTLKDDQRTRHIPVIMITALNSSEDRSRAMGSGADDFISKPYDSIELMARVKSLLRLKAAYNQLKAQNDQLRKQKAQLEREDELKRSLTELIVHDMRNPLFVIQGNIQMMHMLNATGQGAQHEKYAQRIDRSARGLLRMLLNLIDISRLEADTAQLTPVPCDLRQLTDQTIEYLKDLPHAVDKHVHVESATEAPAVYADIDLLSRIWDNLLNYLLIGAEGDADIQVHIASNMDGQIEIRMANKGQEIPEAFREMMFAKYAQDALKRKGIRPARGLGLIFCKLAIEAVNGSIEIDSAVVDGSGFVIRLPEFQAAVHGEVPAEADVSAM